MRALAFRIFTLLLGTVMLVAACAPQTGLDRGAGREDQPRAPKMLSIAIQREPQSFGGFLGGRSTTAGGASNVAPLLDDGLAVEFEINTYRPQMALELPSVEKGTWKVLPDGRMETAWTIRPNIQWHDGVPFTTADLVFGFDLAKDPELETAPSASERFQERAEAPDPITYVVYWSGTFLKANEVTAGGFPRHILQDLYQRDKAAFRTSTYFTTDFIGTGPYRLVRWEQGSHFELARFDHYYMGRPAFDKILVRIIGDPNVMVAAILAGQVDVVLPVGVDLEAALEVKRRWEGTGNQVRADPSGRLRHLELQFRPDYARPRNGLTNLTVRKALYHAIDRQAMVEVMTESLAPIADSWYPPRHGLRKGLEPFISQFPYDPARAQQLLTEAQWIRGPDGVLVHAPSGERFEIDLWANAGFGAEKELSVVGDGWKVVGVQPIYHIIPAARVGDREYESTHPGPLITNPSGVVFEENRLHSREITSPATRWSGKNRGGYVNPKVDEALDRLLITFDPRQRLPLHQQLLQEQMGDVALMPLYWEVLPILMGKGVRGPKVVRNASTYNIIEWDKE